MLAVIEMSLRYLQNYTTLKQMLEAITDFFSLRHLQNHTTLKQRLCFNFLAFGLIHL